MDEIEDLEASLETLAHPDGYKKPPPLHSLSVEIGFKIVFM